MIITILNRQTQTKTKTMNELLSLKGKNKTITHKLTTEEQKNNSGLFLQ